MEQSYLLLGSNMGERLFYLQCARHLLSQRSGFITACSALYETAAWGMEDQEPFMNQVIEIETPLEAEDLLEVCLSIEQDIGRVRHEKWAARVIDIDILFYGELVLSIDSLQIPHPRLQDRRFTLVPLVELCPQKRHPVLGKSMAELLAICGDELWVERVNG